MPGPAIVALAGIESLTVQKQFLNLIITTQNEAALRTSAANQLAFHIQRHGVMLTEEQILELTTAWKNETDPMIVSAIAKVVGSLHPDQQTVGQRLGKIPAPK